MSSCQRAPRSNLHNQGNYDALGLLYRAGDYFICGCETRGLPESLLAAHRDRLYPHSHEREGNALTEP